jgi:predicted N-acetyltransferase YhbS
MKFSHPRSMQIEDIPSVKNLLRICFDFEPSTESLRKSSPRNGFHVITAQDGAYQGQVVAQIGISHSQVSIYGSRLRIGSIGGVSTHPDVRGQGLGGQLMQHCTRQLHDQGACLMSISGERGLYTRTGNVNAMQFAHFELQASRETAQLLPGRVTVRPLKPGDEALCARIYQADAVHYIRRLQEYTGSFDPGMSWMIEVDHQPAAYLLLRLHWDYWEEPERGILDVSEYAGSRAALLDGLYAMLASGLTPIAPHLLKSLRLDVPWQDASLLHLLESAGITGTPTALPDHTLRLINFPALRTDLAAYIAARLPARFVRRLRFEQSGPLLANPASQEEGHCAIVWHDLRLELTTAEMTRLVMGSPAPLAYTAPPPLDEIITALFPLPSFLPGINYR